jgi:hypothetical protein
VKYGVYFLDVNLGQGLGNLLSIDVFSVLRREKSTESLPLLLLFKKCVTKISEFGVLKIKENLNPVYTF